MEKRVGLILTGGGARAAYQVGVLKAIAEFLPRRAHNPFPVICGTSAGALNAAALAINAQSFRKGVRYLDNIWRNFHANQVYRTDVLGVFSNTARWLAGLILHGLGINRPKRISLLDNSPLVDFLDEVLPCEKIQGSIDAGLLHALSITASGYGSGQSVTFYQGADEIVPWNRARRIGIPTQIENKHLLASSALPFIFPATLINREYFGDGSMRQIAPISSALHLGATRILVIVFTANGDAGLAGRSDMSDYPSLAQIAGHAPSAHIVLLAKEKDTEAAMALGEKLRYRHFIVPDCLPAGLPPKGSLLEVVRFTKPVPEWLLRTLERTRRVEDAVAGAKRPRGEDWITRQGYLRERRGGRYAAQEQARFGKARLEALRKQRDGIEKSLAPLRQQLGDLTARIRSQQAQLAGVSASAQLARSEEHTS